MTSDADPTAPASPPIDARSLAELSVEQLADARLADQGGAPAGPAGAPEAARAARAARAVEPRVAPPGRLVSGRYRGQNGSWQLELRIDVDGVRPLRHVSGDFFQQTGRTVTHFGSFLAAPVAVAVSRTRVTITGVARLSHASAFNRIRITLPRRAGSEAPARADIQWLDAGGATGSRYLCDRESRFFRTVELEEDVESGVTPFASYDTGALPSGGPRRSLSVVSAFAEAGIELRPTGQGGVIPVAPGGSWSNAELHAAMQAQFSQWATLPQWKVWLLHARLHDRGPGLLGIMFDQHGAPRQGCAVFHQALAGNGAAQRRDRLYTCVHELGHCFNLFHSFHKSFMTPPQANRPAALSWMNYPQNFPGGAAAFWSAFPFQFDEQELVHLRHGARNAVIMGGSPFGTGAALETLTAFAAPEQDASGLSLELRVDRSFRLGEPVVVELKLSTRRTEGIVVHRHLHPSDGFVSIAIERPGGSAVVHAPLVEHCVRPETVVLDAARPAIYDSAYIGSGDEGLAFAAPGLYRLRAVYRALDGSRVVSDTLELRVRGAHDDRDEAVADLLLDEQVGRLFTLLGSDGPEMASANARIETLVEEHKTHPLALYGRLVQGHVRARPFKLVRPGAPVVVREARPAEAVALLSSVVDASSAPGRGLDSISLNQVFRRMIASLKTAGDDTGALGIGRRMLEAYRARRLKPHVLAEIARQRDEALGGPTIA